MDCCTASFSTTSFSYNELLAGPCLTVRGTIIGGSGLLKRGQIMTYNTAANTWTIGGADPACGILAADCDTGAPASPNVSGIIYKHGYFLANAIIWPGGTPSNALAQQLHDGGCYLVNVLGAPGAIIRSTAVDVQQFEEAKQRFENGIPDGEKAAAVRRLEEISREDRRVRERAPTAEEEIKRLAELDKQAEAARKAVEAEAKRQAEEIRKRNEARAKELKEEKPIEEEPEDYPEHPGAGGKGAPSYLAESGGAVRKSSPPPPPRSEPKK